MDALKILADNMLPFALHIGLDYVSADKDKVVAKLLVKPELCTLSDIVHGGVLMAVADTVGAVGAFLNLPAGATTTTLESKTNFVAAAAVGRTVVAEATPIHRGRRTMIWQTRLTTEQGKLLALVTQTQMVIDSRT